MKAETGPKPGTNTAVVLELLSGGKTHPEIVAETKLSPTQITSAKAQVYKLGYFPKPTMEERTRDWKASHPGYTLSPEHRGKLSKALKGRQIFPETRRLISLAQGGIWVAIEKYAQMRLSPAEIREAVQLETGSSLDHRQISRALGRARRRGELLRLTPNEELKTIGDRFRPKEEIQRQAKSYVAIKEFMDAQNLEATEVFSLASEVEEQLTKSEQELPGDSTARLTLALFLYARRQNSSGEGKPLKQFLPIAAALGEGWETLRSCTLKIIEATPINPQTNHDQVLNAMVVYGEVSPD